MYDIRQFRPVMYLLVALGFCGYSLAMAAPGLWVISVSLTLLNAYLVKNDLFRPLPRVAANVLTIAAGVFTFMRAQSLGSPIVAVGEFLVILQLVKLYEQRANRDYAQLLVLSLLLMVAGAISTANLLFGIILIAYLFLSLYGCLLFHLKVETDHMRSAMGLSEKSISPITLRQDQRFLPASMRKLTGFVSAFSVSMAVIVFFFFPRGPGAGVFGVQPIRASQSTTGFSEELGFQQFAKITQSDEIIGRVEVIHNGQRQQGGTLLLRGVTHDYYDNDPNSSKRWKWVRSVSQPASRLIGAQAGLSTELPQNDLSEAKESFEQIIRLEPKDHRYLFAMAGARSVTFNRPLRFSFSPEDGAIQLGRPLNSSIDYTIVSDGTIEAAASQQGGDSGPRYSAGTEAPARLEDWVSTPQMLAIARDPSISGVNASGPLYTQLAAAPGAIDREVARNIERYLQTQFAYTLDLTDVRTLGDTDPIYAFLTDFKRGHCEYFAGSMVSLCHALGVKARVVLGFKCDEYNDAPGGGYFIVRAAHAHAWVEVLTDKGWETFDPTSGREAAPAGLSMWKKVQNFADFLQFSWAKNVIAYDYNSQTNIIERVDQKMSAAAVNSTNMFSDGGGGMMRSVRNWFDSLNIYTIGTKIITVVLCMVAAAGLGFIGWYVYEHWFLMRRAKRIGLDAMSKADQRKLARQLGFYDELITLLERRGIRRPDTQTPLEFARSMSFLPGEIYESINRLTGIFYRVRFGKGELSFGSQRLLGNVIARIETDLPPRPN